MKNPFVSRGPIHSSEMFFGRVHELNEMASFLYGKQSVSIVGPRKIGKTSLLFHLMRPETHQKLNIGDTFLFVYLDCEVLGDCPHSEIFQQFAMEISYTLETRGLPDEPALERAIEFPTRLSFETAVRKLNRKGLSIVLMLDEFERLSVNPYLNINFFNALRSAAGRYQLSFITVSQQPLIQLTYSGKSQEILSSPFFNIFAQLYLRLFPYKEAKNLITGTDHHFSSHTIKTILKFAGGHPFVLQVVSFYAIVADGDLELMKMRALQELEPHFSYYWHNLSRLEKDVLTQLDEIEKVQQHDTATPGAIRDLTRKCLVIEENGRYRLVSEAWVQFIQANHTEWLSIEESIGLLTGRNIGAYRFEQLLGRGGMSEVYKGMHIRLNREVAIKILSRELANEKNFRDRFEREAQAVATLQHPNIVQIYDFGEEEEIFYMVIEYIKGKTLLNLLNEKETLSLEETIHLLTDVSDALDYAHKQGVVHRDVKPSNILITQDDQGIRKAVLTDFGIAKIRTGDTVSTQPGALLGTLNYMSPEQIQGLKSVDKFADIYSLGVVAYRMLTGLMPYTAENVASLLMAHMMKPVPDPKDVKSELKSSAAKAIQKAMAKTPTERFDSATSFINAIR